MTKHYERIDDDHVMLRKRQIWRLYRDLSENNALDSYKDALFDDPSLLDDVLDEIKQAWLSRANKNELADKLISFLKEQLLNSPLLGELQKLIDEKYFTARLSAFALYAPLLKHAVLLEQILKLAEGISATNLTMSDAEVTRRKLAIRDYCVQHYYESYQQQLEQVAHNRQRNRKLALWLSGSAGLVVTAVSAYFAVVFLLPWLLALTLPLLLPFAAAIAIAATAAVTAGLLTALLTYQMIKRQVAFTLPAFYQKQHQFAKVSAELNKETIATEQNSVLKISLDEIKQELKKAAIDTAPALPVTESAEQPAKPINSLFFKPNGNLRKVLAKDKQSYHGSIWQKIRYAIYQRAINIKMQPISDETVWNQLAQDWRENKEDEQNNRINNRLITTYCADIPKQELSSAPELNPLYLL